MASTPTLPTNRKNAATTIVNSDASSLKTVLTADGTFWDVNTLTVTSDDTSDRLLQFYITIGGTDYLIGAINVPTLSGTTSSAPPVNVLANVNMPASFFDAYGNKVLPIDATNLLKVKSTTTVTAAKTVTVSAVATKS